MLEEKIYKLTKERLNRIGYELVRVKYFDKTQTLQIMIDSGLENTKIGIEDCAKVSQEISVILDIEDLISKKYNLEISSPGLDRPLTQITDFKKHKGHKIKLLLKEMTNETKKCKATIIDVKYESIVFELHNSQKIEIPFANIEAANLLVDDKIFKK